jgi:hypothetical protein
MSNVSEIESDLEQARDQLHRTLDEMNRKAAATGSDIVATEQQIRRYPVASLCGAFALGFAAGGSPGPAMLLGMLAIGGALVGAPDSEPTMNGVGDGAI